MALFKLGRIKLHSGGESNFKIECDSLDDEDWETLAYIGSQIVGKFSKVKGIPRGGIKFAKALEKYKGKEGGCLVVDDVLTTGKSMIENMEDKGLVVFSRGKLPDKVRCIFKLNGKIF